MKRIVLLITCVCFSLSLIFAQDITWEFRSKADFMTWESYGEYSPDTLYFIRLNENEVTLLSIGTTRDTFEIPSTVTDSNIVYQVIAIADSAFCVTEYLHSQLKQITTANSSYVGH